MSFLINFNIIIMKQLEILSTSNKHEEILSYLEKPQTKIKYFMIYLSSMLITQLINQHKMFQKTNCLD